MWPLALTHSVPSTLAACSSSLSCWLPLRFGPETCPPTLGSLLDCAAPAYPTLRKHSVLGAGRSVWMEGWMDNTIQGRCKILHICNLFSFSPLRNKIFLPAKTDGNLCADSIYHPFPKAGSRDNLEETSSQSQPPSLSARSSRWTGGHRNHSR